MFDKVKTKLSNIKDQYTIQKEEHARITRERTAEEKRIEMERIQADKDALMALSEKALMVEIMMPL